MYINVHMCILITCLPVSSARGLVAAYYTFLAEPPELDIRTYECKTRGTWIPFKDFLVEATI